MIYLNYVERASLAASTFTGNLQALGTLPNTCRMIRITNNTSKDLDISFDGVTNHDFLPNGKTLELSPLYANLSQDQEMGIRQNTTVYVSAASGTGDVYLAAYY